MVRPLREAHRRPAAAGLPVLPRLGVRRHARREQGLRGCRQLPGGLPEDAVPVRQRPRRRHRGRHVLGGGALVDSLAAVAPGTSGYTSSAPFGPNYTETSAVESSLSPEPPVTDPPGSSIRFLTPTLTSALTVVGSPRLTFQLGSSASATQSAGPAGELVVFAKVYDIGPDGTVELPRRLISPARIADVTKPVTIELPGIVHRFAPGHRLAIVLTGGDLAYRGATARRRSP